MYCKNCEKNIPDSQLEFKVEIQTHTDKGDIKIQVAKCPHCGSTDLEETTGCIVCGTQTPNENEICDECHRDIIFILGQAMLKCKDIDEQINYLDALIVTADEYQDTLIKSRRKKEPVPEINIAELLSENLGYGKGELGKHLDSISIHIQKSQ